MYIRDVRTEQSHVKLVAIGVLQTRGACHLGADHGDTHGRGRRRGQQARLHPCKWCTARTVLPENCLSYCLPNHTHILYIHVHMHVRIIHGMSHVILHEFTPLDSLHAVICRLTCSKSADCQFTFCDFQKVSLYICMCIIVPFNPSVDA